MSTSDVRFWDVRRKRSAKVVAYEVRWVVAGRQRSRSRRTRELAEAFLAELRAAARRGEVFDEDSGLPASMLETVVPTWLEFAQHYLDVKWPHAAGKSRDSLTDALATVTAALVGTSTRPPPASELHVALRQYLLPPAARDTDQPQEVRRAANWLGPTRCR